MICSACGGPVTWRGPMAALTHTECHDCGARNSQEVEEVGDDCPYCSCDEQPTQDELDINQCACCGKELP